MSSCSPKSQCESREWHQSQIVTASGTNAGDGSDAEVQISRFCPLRVTCVCRISAVGFRLSGHGDRKWRLQPRNISLIPHVADCRGAGVSFGTISVHAETGESASGSRNNRQLATARCAGSARQGCMESQYECYQPHTGRRHSPPLLSAGAHVHAGGRTFESIPPT